MDISATEGEKAKVVTEPPVTERAPVISQLPPRPEIHTNGHHGPLNETRRTDQQGIAEARHIIQQQQEITRQQPGENTHQARQRIEREAVDQILAGRTADQTHHFTRQDAQALLQQYLTGRQIFHGNVEIGGMHITVDDLERQLLRRAQADAFNNRERFKIDLGDSGRSADNPAMRRKEAELNQVRQEHARQRDIDRKFSRPEGENTNALIEQEMQKIIGEVITPEVIAEMKYFSKADAHDLIESYRNVHQLDNSLGYIEVGTLQLNQQEIENRLLNYVRRTIVQRMANTTGNWVREKYNAARDNVNARVTNARTRLEVQDMVHDRIATTAAAVRDLIPQDRHGRVDRQVAAHWLDRYLQQHNLQAANDGLIEINDQPVSRQQLEQEIIRLCQATDAVQDKPEPTRWQKIKGWWTGNPVTEKK